MLLAFAWWFFKKPSHCNHWWGDSPNRLNIWIRGGLYFLLVFGWYRGLELVPIGDAEAIIFIAPLLIVGIARIVLKEPLSKVFPLTILLTIAGIVFVCQPEFLFGSDTRPVSIIGLVFLIIMAISWSLSSILVRTAKTAHWIQIQLVAAFQGSFIWTPICILINRFWFHSELISGGFWVPLTEWKTVMLIIVCALCGFAGLTLNVIGYQIGEATKVAWMEKIGLTCLLGRCLVHLIGEMIKYRRSRDGYIEIKEYVDIEERIE